MYKLLLVDDEIIIRTGIKRMIPWDQLGIGEVLVAQNGTEAVHLLQEHTPDILLTDISMTEMDGLALIAYANKTNPNLRILVLTGYDSFEYAQQCCKMQVKDFLLKPISQQELTNALQKQVDSLNAQKATQQKEKHRHRTQGAVEQTKLELRLRWLLAGTLSPQEIAQTEEALQLAATQPMQMAVLPLSMLPEQWTEHRNLLVLSVKSTCIELFDAKQQGITLEDSWGDVAIVVFTGSAFPNSYAITQQLSALLAKEYGIPQKMVVGSSVEGLGNLSASYQEARALAVPALQESDGITIPEVEANRYQLYGQIFTVFKDKMREHMGCEEDVLRIFASFRQSIEAYQIPLGETQKYAFDLIASFYFAYLQESGQVPEPRFSGLLTDLMKGTQQEVLEESECFLSELLASSRTGTHELVDKALGMIHKELSQPLSVAKLAEALYVSPNHFSHLFKKTVGVGCNEYIVARRMEQAKYLLGSTNHKIGQIAVSVGYQDINYFSLAFKRHTGMSPTQYRKAQVTETV